jgi:hypothetical protein
MAELDLFTKRNFRVGGSGFTAFQWDNKVIAFARGVRVQSPRPVAQPVAIQPLDQRYPLDIITPAALGPGQLQIETFEKYGERVWDEMMGVIDRSGAKYNDLVEIFIKMAELDRPIHCMKIINPPKIAGKATQPYADIFLNCKITDIGDEETVEIGTMEIVKNITVTYTRKIRSDRTDHANIQTSQLPQTSNFSSFQI